MIHAPGGGLTRTTVASLGKLRLKFVVACAAVGVAGFAVGHSGNRAAAVAVGALSAAAIVYGLRVMQPSRAIAWLVLAGAVAVLALGETSAGLSHTLSDQFPSPSDAAAVLDYLPLAIAVLWIGQPPSPRRYLSTALDAAVLTLAATLLAWITLIRPILDKLNL